MGVQSLGSKMWWGFVLLDTQTIGTAQFNADGDKLTTPSASSIFLHELLDHGLDLINNDNTDKSNIKGEVNGVYYHNQALKNVSNGKSTQRNASDHGTE